MFALLKLSALVLILGLSAPTLAEETHHPSAGAAPTQTTQAPQAQPARPVPPGMGMMGQGGDMMGMPGAMPMMGTMQPMQGGRHVEGRLAFLRAELKITTAQEKVWNDFANAVRQASAKAYEGGGMRVMSGTARDATPMQVVEQYERQLAARLEAVRIVKPTVEPLYAGLSDEQKKTFTEVHMILHGLI